MSTPVGPMVIENHDEEDECNIQVVLVIDAQRDIREYRYDCYDPAGNMLERVGYTHGVITFADGHVQKGDTIRNLGPKQKTKLAEYLKEIGVE